MSLRKGMNGWVVFLNFGSAITVTIVGLVSKNLMALVTGLGLLAYDIWVFYLKKQPK